MNQWEICTVPPFPQWFSHVYPLQLLFIHRGMHQGILTTVPCVTILNKPPHSTGMRCKMPISQQQAPSKEPCAKVISVLSDSWILRSEYHYVLHRWRNWASKKSRDSPDHRLQVGTARLQPRKPCLRPWVSTTAYSWVGVNYQQVYNFMVFFFTFIFWKHKLRDRC